MSWISIEDHVGAMLHLLASVLPSGPVDLTAPAPVTNREFTKTLGAVLRRPTAFPVPALAIRILFGEMGEEALLASQRVLPGRLAESGFAFRHPTLEGALRAVLS
jgi:NAD dependent epimerase/dehydratase family enzyme